MCYIIRMFARQHQVAEVACYRLREGTELTKNEVDESSIILRTTPGIHLNLPMVPFPHFVNVCTTKVLFACGDCLQNIRIDG